MRTLATLLCMTALAACRYDSSIAATGEEGGLCLPGDTCSGDLVCSGKICVDPGTLDDDAGLPPDSLPPNTFRQVIGAQVADIDLLFVIDNSGSMREEQDALAAAFSGFIGVIGDSAGGLPNLHLGVVSTDVGAGPFGIMGCSAEGDNGILQSAPSEAGCTGPSPESYISDVRPSDGPPLINYVGSLEDAFSCIARLGTSGCGFEQTFESMRRALDGTNLQNSGFLRDNAMLAVVIVTDEDDCSASDVNLFDSDPALDRVDSSLGFLSSYRCFEFGVTCDETLSDAVADRQLQGPRTNCVPREPSPFMFGVSEYADFLRDLKPAGQLMVSAIAGVGAVTTALDDLEPTLQPACVSAAGEADPAVRIDALMSQLGMPPIESICNESLANELTAVADNLFSMISGRCLVIAADECVFADVESFGSVADETVIQFLPPCTDEATGPCHSKTPASASCPHGSGVEVSIDRRTTAVPPNTVVVAACPRA